MLHKKKYFLPALLAVIGVISMITGYLLIVMPYQEGYEHMKEEENLADAYLNDLIEARKEYLASLNNSQNADSENDDIPDIGSLVGIVGSTGGAANDENSGNSSSGTSIGNSSAGTWTDDNWFVRDGVTYTPDYAQGIMACVLEVPAAGIRRGVYTGAVEHDLEMWMVVQANDSYALGVTHYAIYGHNATQQDLSFNRLQTDVKIGDTFTLTNIDGVYTYEATALYSMWRESVTRDVINNWSLGSDKCYLITCGRNEHRYKDYIVEGTLIDFVSIDDLVAQRQQD